ncbi:hypothetical protein GCM10009535_10070 [Streptomyces thermocarboxydovorans]|uniref:Uncharacterized protein n=1 Tax=Streptomyces thermocarboxydovorans TaxID=59298 RepID=A0ABN1HAZ0_9ACTN
MSPGAGAPVTRLRNDLYTGFVSEVREDGTPVPWPCVEPEKMDERRAEAGIEPFDEYVAKFSV